MLTGHKILFAHSDQKLAHLYKQKLPDFKFYLSHDGLSAVRLVRDIRPNLILSDYHLPILSGASLIKFVRAYPPTEAVPFIFLSDHGRQAHALELAANDWLDTRFASSDLVIAKILYHLKLGKPIYV